MKTILLLLLTVTSVLGAGRNYQPRVGFSNSLSGAVLPPVPMTNNLVAYWKMESATATTRVDAHPAFGNNDMTNVASSAQVAGQHDNAAAMGGSSYLQNGDQIFNVGGTTNFTIRLFVKQFAHAENNVIVAKWDASPGDESFLVYENAVGTYNFLIRNASDSGNHVVSSAVAITNDLWTHIAAGYTNGSIWIQCNDETRAEQATGEALHSVGSTTKLAFGAYSDGGGIFTIAVDEAAFWLGRTLTSIEVTNIASNFGPGSWYDTWDD